MVGMKVLEASPLHILLYFPFSLLWPHSQPKVFVLSKLPLPTFVSTKWVDGWRGKLENMWEGKA
jgi:hypothetical protein